MFVAERIVARAPLSDWAKRQHHGGRSCPASLPCGKLAPRLQLPPVDVYPSTDAISMANNGSA